jgi:hypothetical protein
MLSSGAGHRTSSAVEVSPLSVSPFLVIFPALDEEMTAGVRKKHGRQSCHMKTMCGFHLEML